jgi:16S rRNA A1518/A1519 N6-dimethyltransferase RsmA/KsgA/DIM1 with predicted DNA glycosylase/AP lyase activity
MHGSVGALTFHSDIIDIGTGLGNFRRHLRQYAALICRYHLDTDLEQLADVLVPRYI